MKLFSDYLSESYINESGLSRLYKHYTEHDTGTISAFRGENTKAENIAKNKILKAKLLKEGYSVTEIDGIFVENYGTENARNVSERSFFVVDIKDKKNLKKTLITLGEEFIQDSITFSDVETGKYFLIGTKNEDGSYPEYHQEVILGKPMMNSSGEFHSRINGRPFEFKESVNTDIQDVFENSPSHSFDDTLMKYSNGSKFYISKLAKNN